MRLGPSKRKETPNPSTHPTSNLTSNFHNVLKTENLLCSETYPNKPTFPGLRNRELQLAGGEKANVPAPYSKPEDEG